VQDPHARVVDPRDAAELGRLLTHRVDAVNRTSRLSTNPMFQPVDAAIGTAISRLL
jgi:hypothetical protein